MLSFARPLCLRLLRRTLLLASLAVAAIAPHALAGGYDTFTFPTFQPAPTFNPASGLSVAPTTVTGAGSAYTLGRIDVSGTIVEVNGTTVDFFSENKVEITIPGYGSFTGSLAYGASYSGSVAFSASIIPPLPLPTSPFGGPVTFKFYNDFDDSPIGQPDSEISGLTMIFIASVPTACCNPITGACTVAPAGVDCSFGSSAAPGTPTPQTCAPWPCPFPGATFTCDDCTWVNGIYDGRTGQASHLGGAVPNGAKAADDFYLCEGYVHDLNTISATILTTTTPGLVKPKAEIWSDCDGCPRTLLYTFDQPVVVETGLTAGPAFDGRPLRIVHVTFDVSRETIIANRNVVLHGGNYWLSVYGRSDGLGPSMQMFDVTYWGTSAGPIKGKPAYKIDGNPSAVYNVFNFSDTCGPTGWHSVVDDCCIGCTDLNFSFCASPCKILVDNGAGRRQIAAEAVGASSRFATASLSAAQTRAADDFVLPPCDDYRICYVEACVLTNCPSFEGVFELYENDCNKPSYALLGQPLFGRQFIATKIIPLNYTAFMEGKTVSAFKLEFHDVNIFLSGGQQYWISAGVKYTFSINERAFFCYNADCARSCLIRWNEGRALTSTTLDADAAAHGCTSPTICNGWAKVGNDFSFLIAVSPESDDGGKGFVVSAGAAPPSCTVDFNRDGTLNVQDIFDFLSAWFTGCN